MDIHNIDEYLDLQDQSQINLLSTEELATVPEGETEWHSAPVVSSGMLMENPYIYNGTPNTTTATTTENNNEWGLLNLQSQGYGDMNHFITPDSLLKQPPIEVVKEEEEEEKRVTRSRASGEVVKRVVTPKKKKTKAKKLYCICQQPYSGKAMVQCDYCSEWYHCACVGFNPEDENEDSIDWACKKCIEDQRVVNKKEESTTATPEPPKATSEPPITITIPARQTRSRNQSTCLYSHCNNRTKADSYCSDVCARKDKEVILPDMPKETRKSRMRTAAASVGPEPVVTRPIRTRKKSVTPERIEKDEEYVKEPSDVEEEEETKEKEGTSTPDTPMSPSQMTEQENPVRRNVIKNMSAILKTIIETAVKENEGLFDDDINSTDRAETLAKSIENTMLEQLGDTTHKSRYRTCGEPYKSKFRSLLYNLKDKQNQVFQMRVISGDLSPLALVQMSSEDMANPELKSMSEVFRKTGLKNVVMKLDNTPIIKKTHKGDIIMVPNNNKDHHHSNQNLYSEQVDSLLQKEEEEESPKEETITHSNSFSPSTMTADGTKVDPLDDILARIGIPTHSDENNKRGLEHQQESNKKRKKIDMEELLGKEEEEPYQVEDIELDEEEKPKEEQVVDALPKIWSGRVNMPQVAEFEASARQIGGRTLSESEWTEVLSPTMWIEGRIPSERVTGYVTQNQYSTSREIVLLEIQPTTPEGKESQTLLKYLHSRQRYAVVGHNKQKVKDFYLIPLYKTQHIPDCLYVVRVEETERVCDLYLGVLVLSKTKTSSSIVPPASTTAIASTAATTIPSSSSTQQGYSNHPTFTPSYGYAAAATANTQRYSSIHHQHNNNSYRPSY